jgi:hypothetical protein
MDKRNTKLKQKEKLKAHQDILNGFINLVLPFIHIKLLTHNQAQSKGLSIKGCNEAGLTRKTSFSN